jgi:hypothetical protein
LGCSCCCCCRQARHPQTVLSPGRPPGRTGVAEFLFTAGRHSVNKMRNLVRECIDKIKKIDRRTKSNLLPSLRCFKKQYWTNSCYSWYNLRQWCNSGLICSRTRRPLSETPKRFQIRILLPNKDKI